MWREARKGEFWWHKHILLSIKKYFRCIFETYKGKCNSWLSNSQKFSAGRTSAVWNGDDMIRLYLRTVLNTVEVSFWSDKLAFLEEKRNQIFSEALVKRSVADWAFLLAELEEVGLCSSCIKKYRFRRVVSDCRTRGKDSFGGLHGISVISFLGQGYSSQCPVLN